MAAGFRGSPYYAQDLREYAHHGMAPATGPWINQGTEMMREARARRPSPLYFAYGPYGGGYPGDEEAWYDGDPEGQGYDDENGDYADEGFYDGGRGRFKAETKRGVKMASMVGPDRRADIVGRTWRGKVKGRHLDEDGGTSAFKAKAKLGSMHGHAYGPRGHADLDGGEWGAAVKHSHVDAEGDRTTDKTKLHRRFILLDVHGYRLGSHFYANSPRAAALKAANKAVPLGHTQFYLFEASRKKLHKYAASRREIPEHERTPWQRAHNQQHEAIVSKLATEPVVETRGRFPQAPPGVPTTAGPRAGISPFWEQATRMSSGQSQQRFR